MQEKPNCLKEYKFLVLLGILLFSLLSFIGEGRLRLEDWYQVIHSLGGGGHHENLSTILKKSLNPNFLSGDLYADSLKYYFFPYVEGMKFFYKLGVDFNIQSIILQWIGRISFFAAIYSLSRFLTTSKLAAWISFAFLVRTRIIIGEFAIFSYFDPNMEISMAICLFSILLFLKGKKDISACLAGIGTLFHYRFPVLLLLFYLIWITLNWKSVSKKTFFIGTGGSLLFSIPFLIMIIPLITNQSTPENNEIAKLIILSAIGNEFSPFTTIGFIWPRYAFLFLTSIIGIKYFFSSENKVHPSTTRDLKTFLLLSAILVGLQYFFTEIIPTLLFLKLQTNRILQFCLILTVIWTSQWYLVLIENSKSNFLRVFIIFSMISLHFSDTLFYVLFQGIKIYPIFCLALFTLTFLSFNLKKLAISKIKLSKANCYTWITIFALLSSGLYFKRLSDVVPERWKLVDDWKSVQIWAKSNTHPDSIFFTPGGSAGFRTFSDRRCVGKLYDLHLVLSLDPKMVPEIYQRLQDIEIPLINSLDKRRIYWEGKIKNKNSSEIRNKILDEKKYIKIRQKIHFNYIIRDKNFPLKFKKVFSNNTFVVYKMKDLH